MAATAANAAMTAIRVSWVRSRRSTDSRLAMTSTRDPSGPAADDVHLLTEESLVGEQRGDGLGFLCRADAQFARCGVAQHDRDGHGQHDEYHGDDQQGRQDESPSHFTRRCVC